MRSLQENRSQPRRAKCGDWPVGWSLTFDSSRDEEVTFDLQYIV